MSINRCLQRENMGGEGSMGKDPAGFISANKARYESGLSGLRHLRIFTDVDGL